MRLLLAEDEADLAEALGVFFKKNHFSYPRTRDINDMLDLICEGPDPGAPAGSRSPARTRCRSHAAAAGARRRGRSIRKHSIPCAISP